MTTRKTRNRTVARFEAMEKRLAPSGGVVPVYYGTPPAPIVHGGGGGGGGQVSGGGSTGLPDTFVH